MIPLGHAFFMVFGLFLLEIPWLYLGFDGFPQPLRSEVFFILQTDDGKRRMMLCMGLLQTHLDDYDDTNLL